MPIVLSVSFYKLVIKSAEDPLNNLTYDDEGDLDEASIIQVMDLHFKMGEVPKIRKEFNKKRLEYLKKKQLS